MSGEITSNLKILKTYQDILIENHNNSTIEVPKSLDIKFLRKVEMSLSFFDKFKLKDYFSSENKLHIEFEDILKNNNEQKLSELNFNFAIKEFMMELENQIFLKFFKFLNILSILQINNSINSELLNSNNSNNKSVRYLTEIIFTINSLLFLNHFFSNNLKIQNFDKLLSEFNLLIPSTLLVQSLQDNIAQKSNSMYQQKHERIQLETTSRILSTHLSIIVSFHLINPYLFKSFEKAKLKIYQNKIFKSDFCQVWNNLFNKNGDDNDSNKRNETSSFEGISTNFEKLMISGILQLMSNDNEIINNNFLKAETLEISKVGKLFEIHDFLQSLIDTDCSVMDDSDVEDYENFSANDSLDKTNFSAVMIKTKQLIKLYSYIMDDQQTMELFCLIYIMKFGHDENNTDNNQQELLVPQLETFFKHEIENSSTISKNFEIGDILHYLNNKIIEFQLLRNTNISKKHISNFSKNNLKILEILKSDNPNLKFKILFEFLDQNNLNFRSWFPVSRLESDNSYEMNLILLMRVSLRKIYYDLSNSNELHDIDIFTENITQLHLQFHDSGCKFNLFSMFNDIIYKVCDVVIKDHLHDISSREGISWYSSKLFKLKLGESIAIQPKWNYIFPESDSKVYETHELTDRFLKYDNIVICLELSTAILSILISKMHDTYGEDHAIIKQMLTINIMILETSIKLNNEFLRHFSLVNIHQIINQYHEKKAIHSKQRTNNFENLGVLIKILNNLIEIDLNSINLSIIIYEYLIFEANIPIKDNNYCFEELKTFLTVLQVMFDPTLQFPFSSKLNDYLNGITNNREKADNDVDQSTLKTSVDFKNSFLIDKYDDDCESSISSAMTRTNNDIEYLEEMKAEDDIRIIELNSFMQFLKLNKIESLELENHNKSKEVNFNNRNVSSFNNFIPSSSRKTNINNNLNITNNNLSNYSRQMNNGVKPSSIQTMNANKNFSTFPHMSHSFN